MPVSRRAFLGAVPAALAAQSVSSALNRRELVSRHNPALHGIDPRSPLSVGNGEFAFTADPTGLQTFPQPYETQMPLCTQSQWGWHTAPNDTGKSPADLRLAEFDTFGRKVGYPTSSDGQKQLFDWLRENPHRLHLGRIGFAIDKAEDVRFIQQTLDLWSGTLHSEFEWRGQKVAVETCCHPTEDMIAVTVRGRIPVVFEFPYGSGAMNAADWAHPDKHSTRQREASANSLVLDRTLDSDRYSVSIAWPGAAATMKQESAHRFVLTPASDRFAFCCSFQRTGHKAGDPSATFAAAEKHWVAFWSSGAAIDLSAASDPRARELERRIVLSQYLTAIQCAGSMPPQETGLTCNSWYGKFHLEMHYWHAAHFARWGRPALLERSLGWYNAILPSAREKARQQGYAGARWPKMTAPEGRDSPSPIGPLLIWQQPHPIAMAELIYAAHPNARHAGALPRHRLRIRRIHGELCALRPEERALRARSASHPRAGKSPAARNLEPHLRTRILGPRTRRRATLARARRAWPASRSGTKSAPSLRPCPLKTASTWRMKIARRPSPNATAITLPCWARSAFFPAGKWMAKPCAAP